MNLTQAYHTHFLKKKRKKNLPITQAIMKRNSIGSNSYYYLHKLTITACKEFLQSRKSFDLEAISFNLWQFHCQNNLHLQL